MTDKERPFTPAAEVIEATKQALKGTDMRYLISYDLKDPGKNYPKLTKKLKKLKAEKVLESQWVLRQANTSSSDIFDDISSVMDKNDRLLVVCLDRDDSTSCNLLSSNLIFKHASR